MRRIVSCAAVSLLACGPRAQQPNDVFADGATIVWLGDSITQAALFTQYIETWAMTRYPGRKLHFVNCGVNGDRTQDALLRFGRDVVPWKPTHVVVCLGMNDGGFAPFNAGVFDVYKRAMRVLLGAIRQAGAQPILMSPPPVDALHPLPLLDGGKVPPPMPKAYAGVLARFTNFLEDEAKARGLAFVDVHAPLRRVAARLRLENPGATLIPDRIHPGPVASALIALTFIDRVATGDPARFEARINKREGAFVRGPASGCTVDGVVMQRGVLRFGLEPESLPWVLPTEARGIATIAPGWARHNRAVVWIEGLLDADYTLSVDGRDVVTRNAREWSRGVDLALATRHPDWLQAERVAIENARRNDLIRVGVRELWRVRKAVDRLAASGRSDTEDWRRLTARRKVLEAGLAEVGARIVAHRRTIEQLARPERRSYELRRR